MSVSIQLGRSFIRSSRVVFDWSFNQVAEKSSKPPCPPKEEDHFKKTCKPKEKEVPLHKKARGDHCTILPTEVKTECPKPIEDCTAMATTKEAAKEIKQESKKEAEKQICLAEPLKPSDQDDEGCDPKVVIIGAGIAGLAAASRLATMGVTNLTVLEATNRPGGRIQSIAFGDTVINLGGVWGNDDFVEDNNYMDNPVLYNASSYGLINSQKHMHLAKSMVTEFDGSTLPLAASFMALAKMRRIIGVAQTLKSSSPYFDQGRVHEYIGLRMQQELRAMPDDLKVPAARVFTALAILATGKTHMGADDVGPYVSVPRSNIKIPLGSTGVLSPLLQNVAQYVKYRKEVVSICWGSLSGLTGKRAMVRTTDGCVYNADFIIFTLPLGYMKGEHEKLFCPALPCPKVKTIEAIAYESVNKVFLYYKQPMSSWRQEKIMWKMEEEETKSLPIPLNGLREIRELPGSEKVIGITLVGKAAAKSEIMSENVLVNELSNYIRKRTGECVPYPDDVFRTKWSNSKFSKGSRPTKGSSLLGEPLPYCGSPNPPVIYFAGDCTCPVNPGTSIGAFTSGLREADRILSYLPGKRDEYQATDTCLQLQAALSS